MDRSVNVSEHVLERYADRLSADQKKEKIHELVTAYLIQNDQCIVELLGKEDCKLVVQLLSRGHGQPVLKQIVGAAQCPQAGLPAPR